MTTGTAVEFRFRDETLQADPSGALIWPARSSVVVADLHLEKGSAFAAAGTPLPPYDSRETLRRLNTVLDRVRPKRVICLGDSFHDGDAPGRLGPDETATLKRLTATYEWIWITGNHDPTPPESLGGSGAREFRAAHLTLRHEAARGPVEGEVSGHYHPKAGVSVRNRRVTGRCFVTDGVRLILPAFGAYAGGLDVRDPAIESLLQRRYTVFILGRARVHRIPREVIGDPAPPPGEREPRLL